MKTGIAIVFFRETHLIWGVFSTEHNALKALRQWKANGKEFYLNIYDVDFRMTDGKFPPRYVSDDPNYVGPRTLADLADVSPMDRTSGTPVDSDDNFPIGTFDH